MAYINETFYEKKFGGRPIPAAEFPRLAELASDIVDMVCTVTIYPEIAQSKMFKKAVSYEVELLYEQGGVDAIMGLSDTSQAGGSESLGDYSVSAGGSETGSIKTLDGVPLSPMMLSLLERLGLTARWAFAAYYQRRKCYG